MPEQRNLYKGSPPRPWVRLVLVGWDGSSCEVEVLADTGNPCALIVGEDVMRKFNLGTAPGMRTNFGPLAGGWLRIRIPPLSFDEDILCYSSDAVLKAAADSHTDFAGLAGLPLLRMAEYGGDGDGFWIRTP